MQKLINDRQSLEKKMQIYFRVRKLRFGEELSLTGHELLARDRTALRPLKGLIEGSKHRIGV